MCEEGSGGGACWYCIALAWRLGTGCCPMFADGDMKISDVYGRSSGLLFEY